MLELSPEALLEYCNKRKNQEVRTEAALPVRAQDVDKVGYDLFLLEQAYFADHESRICDGERDLGNVQPTPIGDE